MESELEKILALSREMAKQAGEVLLHFRREGANVRSKSDGDGPSYDLVSDADIASERLLGQLISDAYPGHEILGEEEYRGDSSAEHLWVIDPLDGTNNYAHSVNHFAVSIGYLRAGQPTAGVVYNPASGDCYHAAVGSGAFRNDQPIRVDPANSLDQVLIGCGFYYDRGEIMRRTLGVIEELFGKNIHGIRRWGTASLDLCAVADGQFGGFFEYQLSPWDVAAGRLIVTEAGGLITNASGGPIPMEQSSVVAGSPEIHSILQEMVQRHQRSES
ncbi:MAG: inositol monophosphatase family protein [Planctomycetota bacterium]